MPGLPGYPGRPGPKVRSLGSGGGQEQGEKLISGGGPCSGLRGELSTPGVSEECKILALTSDGLELQTNPSQLCNLEQPLSPFSQPQNGDHQYYLPY